ncbi:hypothetical protein MNBD_GAMMA05-1253 [hydrothermal vent metagenome]|uniref:Sulfotransferase domain-containing protein n=1 Tax=hydrothermal vent metagenome TaxID=652676 RepID=A0A3B0XAC8_9ZZZZ
MKPNLFIIGAPKTGSTSLYHYLADHPQVYLSTDKEPHFFSQDLRAQCQQLHGKMIKFNYSDISEYEALFENAGDHKILGETSTSYLYSTDAAENIHQYNPDAKIIAILRSPVELLHSWYHYISYTSEEPAKTFPEALSLEASRKRDLKNIPDSVWYPQRIFYRELVNFDQQLQRYYDLFDHDNIKVLLTEDMQADPAGLYDEVLDFLSLDKHTPDFSRHNVYQDIRFKKLKWIIDNYLSPVKNAVNNSDSFISKSLRAIYNHSMSKDEQRPSIEVDINQQLKEEFRPMVERTEKLVQLNLLDKWDY